MTKKQLVESIEERADIPCAVRSRWTRRLRTILLVVMAVCAAGFCFERYQRYRIPRLYPPAGELVHVRDRTVHVVDQGTGSPTVVFESGLGSAGTHAWSMVQPDVAEFTRTISYDRNGYLWSDPAATPRDSKTINRELLEMLRAINAPPPYVLVGHSMGGIHMRVFANDNPDLVVGLVLVDASHPDQESRLPSEMILEPPEWQLCGFELIANLGTFRFVNVLNYPNEQSAQQRQVARDFFPAHAATICAEIRAQDDNFREARYTVLGDMPVRIVTAGLQPRAWHSLQRDLCTLSNNAERVVAWGADHRVPWQAPNKVAKAIIDLMTIYRQGEGRTQRIGPDQIRL